MKHTEIYKVVQNVLAANGVVLGPKGNEWLATIGNPLGFYRSSPDASGNASACNDGEPRWQRELYDNEQRWYDIELPIGQTKQDNVRISSKRIDMIGYEKDSYVLCELKYADKTPKHKAENCDSPLDALLQLLAYYAMLVQNAPALDANNVHHTENARNKTFRWQDVAKNVKLLLKAPSDYWCYYGGDKSDIQPTGQNGNTFRAIVAECGKLGLCIDTE